MTASLLEAALALAAQGLAVFQCHSVRPLPDSRLVCTCGDVSCTRPGKHPHPRYAPRGLKSASTRELWIKAWWNGVPYANIGLVCDGLIVLDVDPPHGGDQSLMRLENNHGPLPATWRSTTGGRGEHIFFRAPAGSNIRPSVNRLGAGIDVRANGSYIVAPPSLHRSGRRYSWNVDAHPDETLLAEAPEWLVEALAETVAPKAKAADYLTIARDGVAEGARNVTLTRLAGHLLRRYVDPHLTLELMMALNTARFRPPLEEVEVRNAVSSIAQRELHRREAGRVR